jgi:hypothetical protein
MCWFWYRWHANYIWICSNIFMYVYNNMASFIQTHRLFLLSLAGLEHLMLSKA